MKIDYADVAKLADALDLGSSALRRAGSIPVIRTNSLITLRTFSIKALRVFYFAIYFIHIPI